MGATHPSGNANVAFKPDLPEVKADVPDIYADKCHVRDNSSMPRPCEYGEKAGTKLVVLVGDSHAAQWLPALQALAAKRHWRVITETKSSCPLIDVARSGDVVGQSCTKWNRRVVDDLIALRPDLVVTSLFVGRGRSSDKRQRKALAEGLKRSWSKLTAAGIEVVAIRTTPQFPFDVPDCLSKYEPDREKCSLPRKRAIEAEDPITQAAKSAKGVVMADMTDAICSSERCEPVVGNVLVYRDVHHLTSTYAASLAPFLDRFIEKALKQKEARAGAP
jgi:hypothetical protein